jgi:transposase, IS30 family
MAKRLSVEVEREVRRLAGQGFGFREVARRAGVTHPSVIRVMRREPLPAEAGWCPPAGRLSIADREEIRAGLERGESFTVIARQIGRAVSSVSREVGANGGRDGYVAWRAHCRAAQRSRRPKPFKLACPRLAGLVSEWLQEWWSPQEIARRLRIEFPDDPMMHVSHETIYQSLFVQGRGELRRELHRCLRSGRAKRRAQGREDRRGKIADMVMISERPAEVADRAVPGHWEGDLIIGKNGKSAIGTLVERATRYVMLLHLPDGRDAEHVKVAMQDAIVGLPEQLRRTVTWDQGKEMANHVAFTVETGVPIYFCDPHSPWQRGSNENTNGLLRQYLPKGTNLNQHSAADLARIAASLNNRPRKTLDYMKPSEKLAEFLATTG